MRKRQFDNFLYIGKPLWIKSEDIDCGVKLTFRCKAVKITLGNLTGFLEDCEIIYYSAKNISIEKLNKANSITLEGIISQEKETKNRILVALAMRGEE